MPLLDDKAESDAEPSRRGRRRRHHRGGQGGARRARRRRARLAAADRQRGLPGRRGRGPRPRARAAAGAAGPRHRRQADPGDQHAASRWCKAIADAKLGARDGDVADLSELLLDQAQILDGEVPDDPAAFAARLNRLVVRGLPGGGA